MRRRARGVPSQGLGVHERARHRAVQARRLQRQVQADEQRGLPRLWLPTSQQGTCLKTQSCSTCGRHLLLIRTASI